MLFAPRAGMLRVLVLPATTLLVMLFLPSLSPSNAVRFQWVAALGAALLIARPLLSTLTGESPKDAIRDRLLAGLLLLAIGARDSFGLGELAAHPPGAIELAAVGDLRRGDAGRDWRAAGFAGAGPVGGGHVRRSAARAPARPSGAVAGTRATALLAPLDRPRCLGRLWNRAGHAASDASSMS